MAAGFVIHHRLKDRVKDGHSGYPLTRATPLSEQRSVLFPQLLELCPNLPFTPSTPPPPLSEQRSVLFPQLLEPRFPQKPQFGTTASLVHSVGPRAPARQMVVRITLCACLEGREGTGYQPNCVLICPLQLPPPPPPLSEQRSVLFPLNFGTLVLLSHRGVGCQHRLGVVMPQTRVTGNGRLCSNVCECVGKCVNDVLCGYGRRPALRNADWLIGFPLRFAKVPSHADILGNTEADCLADKGRLAHLRCPVLTTPQRCKNLGGSTPPVKKRRTQSVTGLSDVAVILQFSPSHLHPRFPPHPSDAISELLLRLDPENIDGDWSPLSLSEGEASNFKQISFIIQCIFLQHCCISADRGDVQ